MRDSFKQSSKYSTTSLSGPLLLEDPATKRLRWRTKMHELWIKRYGGTANSQTSDMDVVWVRLSFSLIRTIVNKRVRTPVSWSMPFSAHWCHSLTSDVLGVLLCPRRSSLCLRPCVVRCRHVRKTELYLRESRGNYPTGHCWSVIYVQREKADHFSRTSGSDPSCAICGFIGVLQSDQCHFSFCSLSNLRHQQSTDENAMPWTNQSREHRKHQ